MKNAKYKPSRSTPVQIVSFFIFHFAFCLSSFAVAQELNIGIATVDITPPAGMRMSGYFSERLATETHDPLLGKAIVFRQGDAKAALVFCDLIGISPQVTARVRKAAGPRAGIPVDNILVAATHSHTGPLYAGALRDHFHQQAVVKHKTDPMEPIDYSVVLAERLANAIARADAAVRPRRLRTGTTTQQGLSFNRRFLMKDGTVVFNPGKKNQDIVRPVGPIDPEVNVLLIHERQGTQPIAGLSSFALHLDTVGGTEYSGDYPRYYERALRKHWGEYYTSLYGTGTCGDINHIDVSHDRPQKGHEEARRIGETLAQTVVAAAPSFRAITQPKFAVKTALVSVPLQKYSPEEVAEAKQNMFKIGGRELSFLDQVKAYKIMDLQWRKGSTIPLEVQVFRLDGDTAIVGLPGEVFVELGLAIKRGSPFKQTFVIELCNDDPDYIPTKRAFAEGHYEPTNSRIQPGGGEMLVEAAVKLLKELGPKSKP